MFDNLDQNLRTMTDRELLLVIAERQQNHIEQHRELTTKVSHMERSVETLQRGSYERSGAYKAWLFIIGIATFISLVITIVTSIHKP